METRREAGLRRVIKASSGVSEDQRLAADQSGRQYVPGGTSQLIFQTPSLKERPQTADIQVSPTSRTEGASCGPIAEA